MKIKVLALQQIYLKVPLTTYYCSIISDCIHIEHQKIDFDRWNRMVSLSSEGRIFDFSWYLNAFCKWDAIIIGDYKGGLAVPKKSSFGLTKVFQPQFIQRCSLMGFKKSGNLLQLLGSYYNQIHFNTSHSLGAADEVLRPNYELDLSRGYELLFNSYSTNVKRNLKKANTLKVTSSTPADVYKLYHLNYSSLANAITQVDFETLSSLVSMKPGWFKLRQVSLNDETVSAALYAYNPDHKRMHYLIGGSNKQGRKLNGMTILHDSLIKEHANSDWIFDFEGSAIPSVAEFYKKFGSTNVPFFETEFIPNALLRTAKQLYRRFRKL